MCFLAHEAIPHHHHDSLKVHKECCHNHKHNSAHNSCNILNHISTNKSISFSFKVEKCIKDILDYSELSAFSDFNNCARFLKSLDQIPILLKSQYNHSSFSLRAPPTV